MKTERLYYVDRLRVFTILSLIPFHAALTYLNYGAVYVKAPITGAGVIPFMAITALLSDFFMSLLFFLSGIASFYSCRSRDFSQYIKERCRKLLLPLLLGILFICPVQAYAKGLYEGFQGNLIQFYPRFFSGFIYYLGYGHLWFLFYLFIFSCIGKPLFKRWQDKKQLEKISAFITKGNRILIPIGFIILLEFVLRPFFHSSQSLINDWANDTVYLGLFLFGYLFAAEPSIQNKLESYFNLAKVFGLLSLLLLLYLNYQWTVNASEEVYFTVLWGFARGIYECSAIVFLVCIGRKFMNKESIQIKYLSKSSFTIYLFHFIPVSYFTLLFIHTEWNVYLKFLFVVSLSYILLFILCLLKDGIKKVIHSVTVKKQMC